LGRGTQNQYYADFDDEKKNIEKKVKEETFSFFALNTEEKKFLRCTTVHSVGSFSAFTVKVLKFASFDTLQISLKMNL
jgi:hypothetical protein